MTEMPAPAPTHESEDHAEARAFAHHHGLRHESQRKELVDKWRGYPFGQGNWRRARNIVTGQISGRAMTAFEYHFVTYSDDETGGYERDALHRFLICVLDLSAAAPALSAVRTDWLEFNPDAVVGSTIDVDDEAFRTHFTVFGDDADFAHVVLTPERAARCMEPRARTEWRFDGDELVMWAKGGRVGEQVKAILDVISPLALAAESYRATAATGAAAPPV
ncbi:MAG: hypothetical protein ACR2LF_05570 [Jatrophihabitantaceae bacterium]